ncbi:MAG: putative 4-hydroxybenzoate polyprenyltransferase [Acidobacteria bacterium]|nr:putative 4-hydroxybenzoate polyprenyltransferase [Acidobacteriota bacterium]
MLRPALITLEMIKIQHTLFALPFALLGALTAAGGLPGLREITWILVAMVGARSAAMAFNRLVDVEIDRKNPRTSTRALPAGLVTRHFVIGFTVASCALLVIAAWQLNPLALALSPVALIIILGYSFTKRFTALSHVFLGLALAVAPIGAAVAVEGRIDPRMWLLAGAVLTWTAGFDVIYSLQDVEFDRSEGLHSIPSRLGAVRALAIARTLHVITIALLISFGRVYDFGLIYLAGVVAAVILLIWQHSIISPTDLSRIDAAFFTANGVLSIVLFLFGACDILLRTGTAG